MLKLLLQYATMWKNTGIIIGIFIVIVLIVIVWRNHQVISFPSVQQKQSIMQEHDSFQVSTNQKPRESIITYTVAQGDTLQSLSTKFSISVNTIKWANNITSDTLQAGETLRILPVTGIAHTVVKGDTIDSVAEKYHTDKQKIIDYPFNHFGNPETFSLIVGDTLIVPDGSL